MKKLLFILFCTSPLLGMRFTTELELLTKTDKNSLGQVAGSDDGSTVKIGNMIIPKTVVAAIAAKSISESRKSEYSDYANAKDKFENQDPSEYCG